MEDGNFLSSLNDLQKLLITRRQATAVVGNKHRTLLGGVGIELAS